MGAASNTGAPPETGMSATRWVLIVAVVIALVLFIAWARREPGFDDRVPDPEDAVAAFVVSADRAPDGGEA
jgi:hypothetical protein